MIPKYLQKNLELFRDDEYVVVSDRNTEVCIVEEAKDGRVILWNWSWIQKIEVFIIIKSNWMIWEME